MSLWRKEKSLLYGLHPERIPAAGARFTYTFGLGGIAVLATAVTTVTGVLLAFYYVPTPEGAYRSVVLIQDVAAFGGLLRGLHYWGAQLMVVAASLHLARIVFTGAYRPPRGWNWLVGLGLLVVTLLWDFSGYVLRWDEGGYWALLIGTNLVQATPLVGDWLYRLLVGDSQLGATALLRFYAWHCLGLAVAGILGLVYHLWRVRRDGGISRPTPVNGEGAAYIGRHELFSRELVAALLASAGLLVVSTLFATPLGPEADPAGGVTADVRAPWIFLWVQALLRFLPPVLAGVGIPLAVLLVLAALPAFDRKGPGRGIWFARERWRVQAVAAAVALAVVILSLFEAWR